MPQASLSSIGLISPSAQKRVVRKLETRLVDVGEGSARPAAHFDTRTHLIISVFSYTSGCSRLNFKICGPVKRS